MSILGFFFFLIIIILVVGLSLISSVLRFIFGIGRKQNRTYTSSNQQHNSQQSYQNNSSTTQQASNKKKIFEKDEGEYVEFEEVKEDN